MIRYTSKYKDEVIRESYTKERYVLSLRPFDDFFFGFLWVRIKLCTKKWVRPRIRDPWVFRKWLVKEKLEREFSNQNVFYKTRNGSKKHVIRVPHDRGWKRNEQGKRSVDAKCFFDLSWNLQIPVKSMWNAFSVLHQKRREKLSLFHSIVFHMLLRQCETHSQCVSLVRQESYWSYHSCTL